VDLTFAIAQSPRESGYPLAIHNPVRHKAHGPAHEIGSQVPFRRAGADVGPASPASAVAGRLRFRRGAVELYVFTLRGTRWATRPAIDSGSPYCSREHPVEAFVAAAHRPITGFVVEHASNCAPRTGSALAEIGHWKFHGTPMIRPWCEADYAPARDQQ
jgi:hypothetical protein